MFMINNDPYGNISFGKSFHASEFQTQIQSGWQIFTQLSKQVGLMWVKRKPKNSYQSTQILFFHGFIATNKFTYHTIIDLNMPIVNYTSTNDL